MIKDVFSDSDLIKEWLFEETVKVANTIEDVRRQMTLLHMNKHLVKIGYGSVPDDLRRFVPIKLPVVDPKFRYVKFTPRKA